MVRFARCVRRVFWRSTAAPQESLHASRLHFAARGGLLPARWCGRTRAMRDFFPEFPLRVGRQPSTVAFPR